MRRPRRCKRIGSTTGTRSAARGGSSPKGVTFFDETLRDGLQNPSVVDPHIEDKLKLLHLMDDLGIHVADIGLPGSSQARVRRRAPHVPEIVDCKLKIKVACAGRTVVATSRR